MPATTTLTQTSLAGDITGSDRLVRLASTSGLAAGLFLYCDGELLRAVSLDGPSGGWLCARGVGGTQSRRHQAGALVYIGSGDQFYQIDPVGSPAPIILVSPYINVRNGTVWFAQGDALSEQPRWWQRQTVVYGQTGAGARTFTYEPTSST